MRTIFIFAYYSINDPVFTSAVLPYFKGLSDGDLRFVLLTFEQKRYQLPPEKQEEIRQELEKHHIIWHKATWHSGFLKPVKKAYDLVYAIGQSMRLMKKYDADVIYSEGYPGAAIGHYLSKLTGKPHVIHTYEPHTDYMVEAGVWEEGAWEARLLKKMEYTSGRHAAAIMTATNAMIEKCRDRGFEGQLLRVPSCVNTAHFAYDPEARYRIRQTHGLSDDRVVMTYLGKFGGMYQEEEFYRLARIMLDESDRYFFFIFTIDDHDRVRQFLADHNIPESHVHLASLSRTEVPQYLSASDIGHVCHRQSPAKRYCSPIKDGEYWGCGLPLLTFNGISDDYLLTEEENIGIVLPDTSDDSFKRAAKEVIALIDSTEKDVLAARCRDFVLLDRSVTNYQDLYREVFKTI